MIDPTDVEANYVELIRINASHARLLEALRIILPLAEAYMKGAPSHPDNAKLEDARAAIEAAEGGAGRCVECGRNYADLPSKLCPACEAYAEHTR